MKLGSRVTTRHTVLSGYVRVVAVLACFLMSGLAPFPVVVSSVFAGVPAETETEAPIPTSSSEDETANDSDPIPTSHSRTASAPIAWQNRHRAANRVSLSGPHALRSPQTASQGRIARSSTLRC